jgi:hypothetical protein
MFHLDYPTLLIIMGYYNRSQGFFQLILDGFCILIEKEVSEWQYTRHELFLFELAI